MSRAHLAPTYISGKGYIPAYDGGVSLETRGTAYVFVQSLAREVSSGSVDLPCFPDVVVRVRNALADSTVTSEKTVRIVGTEPRLAAKMLEMAGSAAFNPSGRPLKDLRTAVTRLGHQLVQSVAVAFAVQQMKDEEFLRPIAKQLTELWKKSIAVGSICRIVARRTKVSPDKAFLTGLLHGIGRLYIMVRAVGGARELCDEPNFVALAGGWHTSIGKGVLETWGFAGDITDAVNDQAEHDRRSRRAADLSDVLIASIILADALELPVPRAVALDEASAFRAIGMSEQDCAAVLMQAELQLGPLQLALGCN